MSYHDKKRVVLILIFVLIAIASVSYFKYCNKRNNEILDEELGIKNSYTTYAQVEKLCLDFNANLKEIIDAVDECNDGYDSVCFNMPLRIMDKGDIQVYNISANGSFRMSDNLGDKLVNLNSLTGINYVECLYIGNNSDGYQLFKFKQTNYKKDDLNYLIYVRTKEQPYNHNNINKLLSNQSFSLIKEITSDTTGYWYFYAIRDSHKYNLYDRVYDIFNNL